MKRQADKRRSERCFEINDWVYLKLQPYVQSSAMSRSHHKLGFKYFGPFQVLDRVGQVAYRLNLPASSSLLALPALVPYSSPSPLLPLYYFLFH
jgi:hypothetical protein